MRRHPDTGDTLLEVLLALLVISLGAVALLTGLATSVAGSATHRGLSTTDAVLKSFAEAATNQIELQPTPIFTACAIVSGTSYGSSSTMTPINYTPPSGFTVGFAPSAAAVPGIQYWSTATNGFVPRTPVAGGPSCTTSASSVSGNQLQLLTIVATGPSATQTLSFGVRP